MRPVPGWGTIPQMLRARAEAHPDAVVVTDGPVRLTLADLKERAGRVARALQALGIAAGDRVAIWAPNTWSWVVTAFGIWDAGAVLVPLSTRAKGFETGDFLERTGARAVFLSEGFLDTSYVGLLDAVYGESKDGRPFRGLGHLETVISFEELTEPRPGVLPLEDFLAAADGVDDEAAEKRSADIHPDDLCHVLSTSGTTGVPKGVMLGHEQMLRAYWDWSETVGLRAGDRYPVVSPFAHGFGVNAGILACVMRAATILPIAVFDPDAALDLVADEHVSLLAGPPTLFARLLGHPGLPSRDVSSLRIAVVGAAAVPEELVREMHVRLGVERIVNAYGLIEGSVVTMTRKGDPAHVVATTAGRSVPGMEVRIADDAGNPLPVGEHGEILVRGYGVTRGYWQAPEQTSEALRDGWLFTGDIGAMDEEGNLSIVGRKKEMFIVGGFNTYPAEIENLLLRHPDVGQAAVVAVPHPNLGEVGWAYIVPEPGASPETADLIAWARNNMSNYKVPRRVFVVSELPVTANGKIDKAQLRSRAGQEATEPG